MNFSLTLELSGPRQRLRLNDLLALPAGLHGINILTFWILNQKKYAGCATALPTKPGQIEAKLNSNCPQF